MRIPCLPLRNHIVIRDNAFEEILIDAVVAAVVHHLEQIDAEGCSSVLSPLRFSELRMDRRPRLR